MLIAKFSQFYYRALIQPLRQSVYNSPKDVYIPQQALEVKYSRSQGPGGQNVNKVNSKADIRININNQDWISDDTKTKIQEKYAHLINNQGDIIVSCQTEREQNRNYELALNKIKNIIYQASQVQKERAYDIPAETQRMEKKRISDKRHRSDIKNARKGNLF